VFDDGDNNGRVIGTDYSESFTVVVGGASTSTTYTATTTTWGTTTPKGTTISNSVNGALIRIALKDAAGNAAAPDSAGGVKVSVSGSGLVAAVNDDYSIADSATYILGRTDFDGSGYAWVNIVDGTAETVNVTLSGSGSMASTFTAPSAVAIAFVTAVPSAADPFFSLGAASGLDVTTAMASGVPGVATANKALSSAITFQTGKSAATAAAKDAVGVADTSGTITGKAGANYSLLVTEGTTGCTYCGTFSITPVWGGLTSQSFTLYNADNTDYITVTSATAAADVATVVSADALKAAPGAALTFVVEVDNQFGAAMVGHAVTASITGRNATVAVASAITDADGRATFKYTDASTSTTSLVDTITFTAATGVTDSATVTYTSATNFGAGSVLLTSGKTKTTGADADVLSSMYWDINGGGTLTGAEAGIQTVTAVVKDSGSVGLLEFQLHSL